MTVFSTAYEIYEYLEESYDPEDPLEFVPGWANGSGDKAKNKLAPGTAFWIQPTETFTASIAGQVLTEASKEPTFTAKKFSLFANPFPVAVNPNDFKWTGLTYGDQIQVLDTTVVSTAYVIYEYLEESYDPDDPLEFVPGWANGSGDKLKESVIPVGQGAWLYPNAAVSLQWTNPIK